MNRCMAWVAVAVLLVAAIGVAGCTATQKGAGAGALLGGTAGAVIGHQSGKTTEGALIGAGVGAAAGGLIGHQVGKVKFCPTCGAQYQEDVQFCPKDGTPLQYRQK